MRNSAMQTPTADTYATEAQRWDAVRRRDPGAAGRVVY
jgi:hypothetical protein